LAFKFVEIKPNWKSLNNILCTESTVTNLNENDCEPCYMWTVETKFSLFKFTLNAFKKTYLFCICLPYVGSIGCCPMSVALCYLPQYPPGRSPLPDFFCVYIFGPSDNSRDLEFYPSIRMELQSVGWSCTRHAGWSRACVLLVWPTWRHCQCCTLLVCRTGSELRSRWAMCTSKSVNFWLNSTKYTLIKPMFPEWNCAKFTSTKPCNIRRFKHLAFYLKTDRKYGKVSVNTTM
jgi:hypothetical protein